MKGPRSKVPCELGVLLSQGPGVAANFLWMAELNDIGNQNGERKIGKQVTGSYRWAAGPMSNATVDVGNASLRVKTVLCGKSRSLLSCSWKNKTWLYKIDKLMINIKASH